MAPAVNNPPANAGDLRDAGSIPGSEDPLEEGMATHSSILAWRIQWIEEPGGLQSIGLKRFGMARHSSTLAWKIPWTEEPGGLQSMGSLGHD